MISCACEAAEVDKDIPALRVTGDKASRGHAVSVEAEGGVRKARAAGFCEKSGFVPENQPIGTGGVRGQPR